MKKYSFKKTKTKLENREKRRTYRVKNHQHIHYTQKAENEVEKKRKFAETFQNKWKSFYCSCAHHINYSHITSQSYFSGLKSTGLPMLFFVWDLLLLLLLLAFGVFVVFLCILFAVCLDYFVPFLLGFSTHSNGGGSERSVYLYNKMKCVLLSTSLLKDYNAQRG